VARRTKHSVNPASRHLVPDYGDVDPRFFILNFELFPSFTSWLLSLRGLVCAGNDPSPAKDLDMTMMNFPGGQERTEVEFRSLLSASGFKLVSITPTKSMIYVIEARPI
jgi:hypothetical protein